MSQNNLQGMCLSSRAKCITVSLIGGKSFGIMNCLQLKILFFDQETWPGGHLAALFPEYIIVVALELLLM